MNELFASITNFFRQVIFWAIVEPWEQAIRVRAGKHVRRLQPGLHLRIPIVDTIHKQSVRLRTSLMPPQTLSTADGRTLVVCAALGYVISDIEQLYRSLHHAEDTLIQIASSALATEVFETALAEMRPEIINARVTDYLAKTFAGFGLSHVTLRVTDFAFIRAFRLIQDGRWSNSKALSTEAAP